MYQSKIVIAMPIEESLLTPLYHWGQRFDWDHVREVHFLHVVKKSISALDFGLIEMPDANTYRAMQPTLERFMQNEAKRILPADFKGKLEYHVTLDFKPEEQTIDLLKSLAPSLIVVSTQGKHGIEGFFHSSFTDHMVKFAPCDVFVVRPETGPKA